MERYTEIDEIIIRYIKAQYELQKFVNDAAGGNWSKLELILENDEQANKQVGEICNKINSSLEDLENKTYGVSVYSLSSSFLSIFKQMEKKLSSSKKDLNKGSISAFLEHIRDDWDWKSEEIEDTRWIVRQLDSFFSLPNYDPDNWLRRKFLIKGMDFSISELSKISKNAIQGFHESCTCFIYGIYLATVAMARSTLELMLKDKFPMFINCRLKDIIIKWDKIDKPKNDKKRFIMAEFIRKKGNFVLHESDEKVLQLVNEQISLRVLSDLKELIRIIYKCN